MFIMPDFNFEIERATLLLNNNMLAHSMHPASFAKYKNAFRGRDVVLVATGPTLKQFRPIPGAIYVGVNRAFQYDKVKLDFLFMADYCGLTYIEDAAKIAAKKFYGILRHDMFTENDRSPMIPESIAIRHRAARYYANAVHDAKIQKDLDYPFDLNVQALTCYGSIALHAMQFILWSNPRRIYIVGCDTNHAGYFDSDGASSLGINIVTRGWIKMKEFIDVYYPETEVISVNPVGLRGIFKDWDQNDQNAQPQQRRRFPHAVSFCPKIFQPHPRHPMH